MLLNFTQNNIETIYFELFSGMALEFSFCCHVRQLGNQLMSHHVPCGMMCVFTEVADSVVTQFVIPATGTDCCLSLISAYIFVYFHL